MKHIPLLALNLFDATAQAGEHSGQAPQNQDGGVLYGKQVGHVADDQTTTEEKKSYQRTW